MPDTCYLSHLGFQSVVRWSDGTSSAAQHLVLDTSRHIFRLVWLAGSASATAAGMVPFAIGTETCGSITSPASQCGVTGLRPSFGAVGRSGVMALAPSLVRMPTLEGWCNLTPAAATTPACFGAMVHLASPLTVGHDRVPVQHALLGLLANQNTSFVSENRFQVVQSQCPYLLCAKQALVLALCIPSMCMHKHMSVQESTSTSLFFPRHPLCKFAQIPPMWQVQVLLNGY